MLRDTNLSWAKHLRRDQHLRWRADLRRGGHVRWHPDLRRTTHMLSGHRDLRWSEHVPRCGYLSCRNMPG